MEKKIWNYVIMKAILSILGIRFQVIPLCFSLMYNRMSFKSSASAPKSKKAIGSH